MSYLFRVFCSCISTFILISAIPLTTAAQSAANSGTIQGTIVDPSGAVVPGAKVELLNSISGYHQTTTTDSNGQYSFSNIPFNNYRLFANLNGFQPASRDVSIRSGVPLTTDFSTRIDEFRLTSRLTSIHDSGRFPTQYG